eukprot:359718-Chlamydomonas_euryale.AAC.2
MIATTRLRSRLGSRNFRPHRPVHTCVPVHTCMIATTRLRSRLGSGNFRPHRPVHTCVPAHTPASAPRCACGPNPRPASGTAHRAANAACAPSPCTGPDVSCRRPGTGGRWGAEGSAASSPPRCVCVRRASEHKGGDVHTITGVGMWGGVVWASGSVNEMARVGMWGGVV